MKNLTLILLIGFVLGGCSFNNRTIKCTYWDEDTKTKIRTKKEMSNDVVDGLCYRYYRNGQLFSRTKYSDNKLVEIYEVYDTLGNKLNYGKLKNGNGYVIMYEDRLGTKYMEGNYVDGLRQGWWKNYTTRGFLLDSIYFEDGVWDNHESYLYLLY